jgi:hypothetical protein
MVTPFELEGVSGYNVKIMRDFCRICEKLKKLVKFRFMKELGLFYVEPLTKFLPNTVETEFS